MSPGAVNALGVDGGVWVPQSRRLPMANCTCCSKGTHSGSGHPMSVTPWCSRVGASSSTPPDILPSPAGRQEMLSGVLLYGMVPPLPGGLVVVDRWGTRPRETFFSTTTGWRCGSCGPIPAAVRPERPWGGRRRSGRRRPRWSEHSIRIRFQPSRTSTAELRIRKSSTRSTLGAAGWGLLAYSRRILRRCTGPRLRSRIRP